MAGPTIINQGVVYRGGSRKPRNLTPRLEKDVGDELGKAGLSAYLTVADATAPGDWCQTIDLARLAAPLAAYLKSDGHVGIAPIKADGSIDVEMLTEWASSRGTEPAHVLTNILLDALGEPIRRSQ